MLDVERPMLRHSRLQISFNVECGWNCTRIHRRIDRILWKESADKQCSKQIDRLRRECICLRRTKACGEIAIVENSITAAQHGFRIAKHVERKTNTRAEIILINIM